MAAFRVCRHGLQNKHLGAYMMFMVGSRWLGFRLDIMGTTLITTVTFAGIAMRDEIGAGEVGLSLVYIMALSGLFQWTVWQFRHHLTPFWTISHAFASVQ